MGGAGMGVVHQERRTRRARGAPFILDHIINVTGTAFDDFASGGSDVASQRRMLGRLMLARRLRLGGVGGGEGAFIGGAPDRGAAR